MEMELAHAIQANKTKQLSSLETTEDQTRNTELKYKPTNQDKTQVRGDKGRGEMIGLETLGKRLSWHGCRAGVGKEQWGRRGGKTSEPHGHGKTPKPNRKHQSESLWNLSITLFSSRSGGGAKSHRTAWRRGEGRWTGPRWGVEERLPVPVVQD